MIAEFHYFRPQETHPEDLNRILVARDDFLDEYLQGLTQSDEANPFQHYLLIGPRGIGKSTLLEVVRYRIEHDPILNRRWEVILLPEENYRITTLADLWLEVLDALAEKHGDRAIAEAYERLRFADNDTTCSESLEMIRSLHEQKGFSLLLLLENLDRLLDKRLPADDIKLWRKTLTEEPWLLTLCSSCTYPAGITNPKKPFLDFFNTYPLEELTLAQQETMLRNLAELRGEGAFEEKLQQFQSRLHALHYFTGGNPRLTVVLYELIVNYNVADTTAELKKLLDRMTPLYQERMNDLPAQEAKLLESLALLPEGESPKELGALARVSEGSVRKLLSRLEEAGYVQRRDTGGRKNAYIIPERFFRIWLRMSRSRAARGQIFYLFEFFKNWYATEQERDAVYTELLDEFREGYEDDRRRENAEAYLSYIEAVSEGDEHYRRVFMRLSETLDYLDDAEILNELEALDRDYRSDVDYWNEKGLFLQIALCRLEEAMQAFKKAEYIDPDNEDTPFLLLDCARVLGDWQAVKRYKKRLEPLFDQDSVGSDETKAERLVRSLLAYENKHWARQAFRQLDSRIDDFLIGELIDSDKNASDSWFRRKLNGLIGRTGKVKYQNYLLDQLQDPDSAVRGSAATALGRIGDPGVVPTLIHVLDSSVEPDSTVRGSAASALGRIGDPKAVPVLIQALDPKAEPDPITRGSAASALGRIGVPKAVPALIQALDAKAEPGSEVRGSAASALGRVRKPKAVPALIQTLDPKAEPDPITRGSAASALGHIGDPRAVPALTQALDPKAEPDPITRGSAASALGHIGDPRAVPALIQALDPKAEPGSEVRGSAASALGNIGDPKTVPALIQALDSNAESGSEVRGSAASALGNIGDPRAVPALIQTLDPNAEPDPIVRGSAASALGRIGDPKAVPALIQTLDPKAEPGSEVRGSAASALGNIGDPKTVPALIQALDPKAEPGSEVRGSAASALGKIGDPRAVPALIQTLDPNAEPDPIVRGSSASALGRIGDPKAVPALIQTLDPKAEPGSDVRGSSASALGRIGDPKAVLALIQALNPNVEPDQITRGSAASALGRIGEPKAVPALIQTLDPKAEPGSDVRGSAASALGQMDDPVATASLIKVLDLGTERNDILNAVIKGLFVQAIRGNQQALLRISRMKTIPAWITVEQFEATVEAAFSSSDLSIIQAVLMLAEKKYPNQWQQYHLTADYLAKDRDARILARQHPEIADAVNLLVDLFDGKSVDDTHNHP